MNNDVKNIISIFTELNKIPRKSGSEAAVSAWLVSWAKDHGFEYYVDKCTNTIIKVPGSAGRENDPTVIIQGHMDMVCQKTPDSPHNFDTDPIACLIDDNGWLHADNTTLGADNGIAIATAMAVVDDLSVSHPPLELLFTTEEETGLFGASGLEPDILNGSLMLNLDSEEEGAFTIGCAGGADLHFTSDGTVEKNCEGFTELEIRISGIFGGHSGIDINKLKANANTVLTRVILYVLNTSEESRLISLNGGTAHNAIPRDAFGTVAVATDNANSTIQNVENLIKEIIQEYKPYEPNISITVENNGEATAVDALSRVDSLRFAHFLNSLPTGVIQMSPAGDNLVETSTNFAIVTLENGKLFASCSQRSSFESAKEWLNSKLISLATLAGIHYEMPGGYPGWTPNLESKLLELAQEVHETVIGKKAKIEVLHAGLECGILGSKYPNVDILSYGPTIKDAHTPKEKLYVPSLENFWKFTVALLKNITKENF